MCTFRMGSVAALLLTLCAARSAAAQQTNPSADSNRATITLGLSQFHETYGSGWGGEIQMSSARTWSPLRIGWVADTGINFFDGFSEFTAMGGVRFGTRTTGTIRPFAQVMAGLEYCRACKTTDPTVEPSAGVDIAVGSSGRMAIRAQVGYRITPSDRRTFKETHLLIGVTFAVGEPWMRNR